MSRSSNKRNSILRQNTWLGHVGLRSHSRRYADSFQTLVARKNIAENENQKLQLQKFLDFLTDPEELPIKPCSAHRALREYTKLGIREFESGPSADWQFVHQLITGISELLQWDWFWSKWTNHLYTLHDTILHIYHMLS